MLSFNKKYRNIIVTIIFLSSAEAEFIVAPSDTEAAVGDNATLYCTSTLGRCEWYHWSLGAHTHEIIFQQGYTYNGYKTRFKVIETNNACNLQIESVSIGDAGLFTCMETSTKATQKTAELIVFEQFPSDKTCATKITCAPTCNDLELSCAMKSYGNLHPIMEWRDGDGKQMNSALNEDKIMSTVHLKKFALQPLTYVCQVKYPFQSLSSKYMWSYSMPAYLEDKTPVLTSTTEQPEQKTTVPISVLVAVIVVSIVLIVALGSTIAIFLLYIRRNKRKLRKLEINLETGGKKMGDDQSSRPQAEEKCHPAEKNPLLDNAAVVPPFTETRNTAICGLAVLGNEVFVVTKDKSIVEVFDLQVVTKYKNNVEEFDLQSNNCKRQWKVDELIDPNDMAACPKMELIFICDWKNCEGEEEIFSLDKTGMIHYRWRCEGERGRISVTKECSLLIADGKKNVIYEYKFNGQPISTTHLKGPDLIMCHAIKLESGNFVASFEDEISRRHEIARFESNGCILDSVQNEPAYVSVRSFSTPRSLAVDSKGNIYLSTSGDDGTPFSNKITSFTPRLEWKENIPDPKTGQSLSDPLRICLCESERSGLLLVADNKISDEKMVEGKIRIFNFTL